MMKEQIDEQFLYYSKIEEIKNNSSGDGERMSEACGG